MTDQATIAAISTPLGSGGIGVVRISGPRALEIGEQIFRSRSGKALAALPGYSALLGEISDGKAVLDEAVATVYRAPRSYTGEDVAELSCHGGVQAVQAVLRLAVAHGAAPAQPGEFTKRAFLNGKLDLAQAEAVMDLIAAQSEAGLKAAASLRGGALSTRTEQLVENLLRLSAHLAAWADYPEEDLPQVTPAQLETDLESISRSLQDLLATYDRGQMLRDGVTTALVGKPNVGKSTLMNLLSGRERSIVTEIPGTTRDVVEDLVRVGDYTLRLLDTAGIRPTEDPVERAGVERSKQRLETAQLVLALFDSSGELDQADRDLLELLRGKPVIAVVNKTDLPRRLDLSPLLDIASCCVELSAREGTGREELERQIVSLLDLDKLDTSAALIMNERQRTCLQQAHASIADALDALRQSFTLDAVGVCIDQALDALLSLTGQRASQRVVEEVFARFCVGK